MNVIKYPGCKINLGLRVTERRADGFHNLETLFVYLPDIADILEIAESDKPSSLTMLGDSLDCDSEENLVMKAYRLLAADYSLPEVEIYLYKRILSGAGLGGGSSDAAMALVILNNMFNLGLCEEELAAYALKLGSDCPFFVYAHSKTASKKESEPIPYSMMAGGRGELLSPFEVPQLSGCTIKIEIPPIHVSTAEAYKGITPATPEVPLSSLLMHPIEEWRNTIVNDFEKHILKKYPVIEKYKQQMYDQGALYASMSGSGSALFGIF